MIPSKRSPTRARHRPPTIGLVRNRLGRDVLSRVLFGARISLMLGVISVLLGSISGTLLGLAAGFYGGWTDTVIMRIMDAFLAFPGLLLAPDHLATLGPSIQNVMLAVGFSTIPQYARLTRGSVLSVRELPYVESRTGHRWAGATAHLSAHSAQRKCAPHRALHAAGG